MDTKKQNLKTMVRGVYDVQKLRIQAGNRIVGNFKAKLGQKPSEKEDNMDSEGKKILKRLRAEFKLLSEGVSRVGAIKDFSGAELIDSQTELQLVKTYIGLEKHEKESFSGLTSTLKDFPVYEQYLKDVRGVGPAMSGVIISEIDIHKALYPSSLWKYAGLDVADDGQGRSRKSEHLVDVEYTAKDGTVKTKKSITFNPFLKTKLTGVLGPSFIKSGGIYADIYYDYKNRLENHPAHVEKTKGHRHNMAIRYCVKRFLVDLHTAWRMLEGLPVSSEYSEAKLGMRHKAA